MLLQITQQEHQRANVCSQIAYGTESKHVTTTLRSTAGSLFSTTASLFFFGKHMCLCNMHICGCTCMGLSMHVCMKARGWESMSSSIFLHFIYLGRVFILTPGLSDSASLANQLALGIPCLCLKCCWDNRCLTHPDLTWILWTWILLLTLGLQALFQASYCP